ncbi:MAG TPA: hypothetical protein H9673_05900 [Candidatus Adamsella sp.]|nr:hypothetical protein [Candidatus Adamsella sp.]
MNAEKEYSTIIKDIITQNKRYAGNEDLLDAFCDETLKRTKSIVSLLKDEEKIYSYILRVSNSAVIKVLKDNDRLGGYRIPHVFAAPAQSVQQEAPQQHEEVYVEHQTQTLPVEEAAVAEESIPPLQSEVNQIDEELPVVENIEHEELQPVVEEPIPSIQSEVNQVDEEQPVSNSLEEPVAEELPAVEQIEPLHTVIEDEEPELAPVFADNSEYVEEEQFEQENEEAASSDVLENIASNLHVLNSQNPTKQYYMIYKLRYIDHMKNKDIAKNMNISEADVTSRLLELSDKLKKCFNQ